MKLEEYTNEDSTNKLKDIDNNDKSMYESPSIKQVKNLLNENNLPNEDMNETEKIKIENDLRYDKCLTYTMTIICILCAICILITCIVLIIMTMLNSKNQPELDNLRGNKTSKKYDEKNVLNILNSNSVCTGTYIGKSEIETCTNDKCLSKLSTFGDILVKPNSSYCFSFKNRYGTEIENLRIDIIEATQEIKGTRYDFGKWLTNDNTNQIQLECRGYCIGSSFRNNRYCTPDFFSKPEQQVINDNEIVFNEVRESSIWAGIVRYKEDLCIQYRLRKDISDEWIMITKLEPSLSKIKVRLSSNGIKIRDDELWTLTGEYITQWKNNTIRLYRYIDESTRITDGSGIIFSKTDIRNGIRNNYRVIESVLHNLINENSITKLGWFQTYNGKIIKPLQTDIQSWISNGNLKYTPYLNPGELEPACENVIPVNKGKCELINIRSINSQFDFNNIGQTIAGREWKYKEGELLSTSYIIRDLIAERSVQIQISGQFEYPKSIIEQACPKLLDVSHTEDLETKQNYLRIFGKNDCRNGIVSFEVLPNLIQQFSFNIEGYKNFTYYQRIGLAINSTYTTRLCVNGICDNYDLFIQTRPFNPLEYKNVTGNSTSGNGDNNNNDGDIIKKIGKWFEDSWNNFKKGIENIWNDMILKIGLTGTIMVIISIIIAYVIYSVIVLIIDIVIDLVKKSNLVPFPYSIIIIMISVIVKILNIISIIGIIKLIITCIKSRVENKNGNNINVKVVNEKNNDKEDETKSSKVELDKSKKNNMNKDDKNNRTKCWKF